MDIFAHDTDGIAERHNPIVDELSLFKTFSDILEKYWYVDNDHREIYVGERIKHENGDANFTRTPKIYEGEATAYHEYPWQVEIIIDEQSVCGGSIISSIFYYF